MFRQQYRIRGLIHNADQYSVVFYFIVVYSYNPSVWTVTHTSLSIIVVIHFLLGWCHETVYDGETLYRRFKKILFLFLVMMVSYILVCTNHFFNNFVVFTELLFSSVLTIGVLSGNSREWTTVGVYGRKPWTSRHLRRQGRTLHTVVCRVHVPVDFPVDHRPCYYSPTLKHTKENNLEESRD